MRAEKVVLADRIRNVFAEARHPGAKSIADDIPQTRELLYEIGGRNWCEILPTIAFQHAESLAAFTPEGLRYYLPAFMLAALEEGDEADWIRDALILILSGEPDGERMEGRFSRFVKMLEGPEVSAVCAFLEYLERDDIDLREGSSGERMRRLIAYWSALRSGIS